ncbi:MULTISPECIES: CDP-glycerol glycerophosphotransferase family protein [Allobacillus]|uniref:CDP-glycerol glycerophosphotransferase family protein n=1 Tax=Allobacillus salarius TaxID=1955272 RepID=A0A556PMT3_9BACI|nr:CDP-glycerol glycerophosphotransferase family protein [Allobacillus salarius]TSJ65659.1 CDP-glycerol glycerophosphotransferase family protein [Allobacillus salarius]
MKKLLIRIKNSSLISRAYRIIFSLIGYLPRRKKTVIFESFHGKQYSDNPRAIYEYMKKHYHDYNLIWSADRRYTHVFKKANVPNVKRLSIRWLFVMGRAKYWIVNTRLPLWIKKPKNTVYVQTWHGTPLKKLGIDIDHVSMPGTNTEKYKKNFTLEAEKWDYLISPNEYSTEIFKHAFQFHKKVIESGYPRNDYLVNSNESKTIEEIKRRLRLPLDKKVLLYAPTWRDNQYFHKGSYKFDLPFDLKQMEEELSDDYVLIFRMHYLISSNLDLSEYSDFAFDFSSYEDIRDLYLVSDTLITDYSSVFFDYAILNRPIIFYVYDLEEYRDELRGFYFDFEEEAPGPLVKTTDGLLQVIDELNESKEVSSLRDFRYNYNALEDGNASHRVVNEIFDK